MWIITSTICIVALGFEFNTYVSTRVRPADFAPCVPVPTYRISGSTATLPGETLYQAVLIGK